MKGTREGYFLTYDIGTTSIKVCLFDTQGNLTSAVTREYALITPGENIVELPVETYWEEICTGTRKVFSDSGIQDDEVISLGACSQGETFVVLDDRGRPLRNAIVWMDNRSESEAEEIRAALGSHYDTGQTEVVATWPITKLLWMKKHEPDIFSRIRRVHLLEDYLVYRLTGDFQAPRGSYALWTSSYMLDIKKKEWYTPVLDFCGVSRDWLPALTESGTIVGRLSPEAAATLGLSPGIPIISGAMDQTASLIGCGALRPDIITETIGAAQALCKTVDSYPAEPPLPMSTQYHALPGKYVLMAWCTVGGMSLKWLRSTFFDAGTSYDDLTALASKVPPGAQGLLFFPFMGGPGTLPLDQSRRGSFTGLEMHHGKGHFIRAIMESMGYLLRYQLEQMPGGTGEGDKEFSEIRSLGGGAQSPLWNQIRADITGFPVKTMSSPESASLGMAILQAAALGVYPDVFEAAEKMVRIAEEVPPNPQTKTAYDEAYTRFKNHLKGTKVH